MAGCAFQDPFALPSLGSPAPQGGASTFLYYGYGPYPRYGYGYGYSPYDYSRYNPYRYGYDSGYVAPTYPPPGYLPYPGGPYCQDANRDGRCDDRIAPPARNQPVDAGVFERLRNRLDARTSGVPAVPAPTVGTAPRRPPPPPKVAPPKAAPPVAIQPSNDATRRDEQPAKRRSTRVPVVEP